jgi:hypothetical protein
MVGKPRGFVPVETSSQTICDMADASTTWQTADDWTLLAGLSVDVHENGKFVERGRVEAVTKDGCIVWLVQEGNRLRRLVEKLPGTELRIIPAH